MSFSGKQKKLALQEKREKDRARAEQEAARDKARMIQQEQERERRRHEESASSVVAATAATGAAEDDDDEIGIAPVRRNLGVAKPTPPAAASTTATAAASRPTPISEDEDDFGGIMPVRRNIKGAAPPAASASASAAAAAAASSSSASASVSSGSTAVPSTINALTAAASAKSLRTAFAKESDESIELRKQQAREPLRRDEMTADGGATSVDYYAACEVPIPMRPDWTGKTAAQLEADEAKYFGEWLESIYRQYGQARLNHFEHNLEVWRQLWRVCERSDILLVVVDARQPILNFPPSLYHYITRHLRKPMILVLNKIDLLPNDVVNAWLEYFHARYPKLFVVPFTSFPAERQDKLDHLSKSKAKRGRGLTLVKPYGADQLLDACRRIVSDKAQLGGNIPDAVRKSFSFDPTLLTGGTHAVDKAEQMYAGADEYMRGPASEAEDQEEIGASSLSKELKEMGVLKKHKAQQRKKSQAEKLKQANEALASQEAAEEDDNDQESKSSSQSKAKAKRGKGSKKKQQSARRRVRMGEVHEYQGEDDDDDGDDDDASAPAADADEVDSGDDADASIVAANTREFSGALGQLEDVRPDAAHVTEFITLGCLGQPNAGSQ